MKTKIRTLYALLLIGAVSISCIGKDTAQAGVDLPAGPELQALAWRFVGPIVGGRGTSVAGHPTDPNVFYFGSSSGGLWKTEDAGQYWVPVGDGQFKMGAVGAIALHEKNPDIMYVGMGEPNLRDSVSWGDGMYKTTDGGATWTHIGLTDSRHIGRIRIHPDHPDLVYVAAMGHAFGPNKERGVFRSQDGGNTWENILFKSEKTGAIDLVMAPADPQVLFATMFEFIRKSWGVVPGGPESGIWRSTDGGDNWEDITRNPGLPEGQMGRVGITMSAADPDRIYALIDSESQPGIYRSDDLGKTWQFVNGEANLIVRPFYFSHIYANPTNADEIWIPTNKQWRSRDAGKTWLQMTGTKDDFHDLWIDPNNPARMIAVHDGGAMVSMNEAKTWSRYDTQMNAQFYRVEVDNQFPYNLYANSQDLNCYKVPSSSTWGGIAQNEVTIVGYGETGAVVPHPTDPDIVYNVSSGSLVGTGGAFSVNNLKTGQFQFRHVWPDQTLGIAPKDQTYRFNWHMPFIVSQHDPETIYAAANVVFRSRDRGLSWEEISGDLTTDDESKQVVSGTSWMLEAIGQENYTTITRLAESPHAKGTLWAGSDDGLVHITRDGGDSWQNVTPPDLPQYSTISEIDVSLHDPATAYLSIIRYRTADDVSPYLFKTTDFGKNWTSLIDTFPPGEITRTIREDAVRQGLLYVGTETGVFVSIDDGKIWRRLNLNLPAVPVHDIKTKDDDLIIATHGRGFWIMDDITALRQWDDSLADKTAHLFKPRVHTRYGYHWWNDYGGGVGGGQKNYFVQNQNPSHTFYELGVINGEKKRKFIDAGDARPAGVVINYLLSDQAEDVSLTILDEQGNEIKTFAQKDIGTQTFDTLDRTGHWSKQDSDGLPAPSISLGLNRFVWDMRYPGVSRIPGKPPTKVTPLAKPGKYQVRLTVNGESQTQPFELRINPNETYTEEQTDARFAFWLMVHDKAEEDVQAVLKARALAKRVETLTKLAHDKKLGASELKRIDELGAKIIEGCQTLEGSMVPVATTLAQMISEPAKYNAKLDMISGVVESSEGPISQPTKMVYEEVAAGIDTQLAAFDALVTTEVLQFDELTDGLQ